MEAAPHSGLNFLLKIDSIIVGGMHAYHFSQTCVCKVYASSGSLTVVLNWWMREGGSRYPRGGGGVAPNGRGTVSEREGQYTMVFIHRN